MNPAAQPQIAYANLNRYAGLQPVADERMQRRFVRLAAAVREHQATIGRTPYGERAHDGSLYRSLRRICGAPSLPPGR